MLAYNQHIVNNCTWRGCPWPSQRGGDAVVLRPYQLTRCCVTRATLHSDITSAGAVLQHSRRLANWRGTCEWSMGAVPARTSTLNIAMREVKRFRSHSACVHMPSVSTTYGLTRQVATTHTVAIIWPHLKAHSSPCTHPHSPVGFGYTSPSLVGCMRGALQARSLFPADRTATTLPFRVQSAESCFTGQSVDRQSVKRRPTVFSSILLTAMSITDY